MSYSLSHKISATDERQEKWKQQRKERGFDDTECWNLDYTIARFVYPRLLRFSEMKYGYPACFDSREEWVTSLEKMVYAFKHYSSEENFQTFNEEHWSKVEEGMKLFAKYFAVLWN